MKHKHKYILDKNNFGICECGKTKQYPRPLKVKLSPSQFRDIESWKLPHDPNATLHGVRT